MDVQNRTTAQASGSLSTFAIWERRTTLIVLSLYIVTLVLFFSKPIFRMEAVSAGDLIYSFDNFKYLNPSKSPSNPLLLDQVAQFEVWRTYAYEQLWNGRLPWNNPYQGGGVPLLGNLQSAFFYPTQWLWFLLGPNLGITLGHVLKLLAAAMGTYLFLRALGISAMSAWVGGLMFAFCGFNIVWLGHPHTNVSALLPWLLLCIHRTFTGGPSKGLLFGLTTVSALIIFGGHPATILHVFFAGFTLAIYLMVRPPAVTTQFEPNSSQSPPPRTSRMQLLSFWMLAGGLAAIVSAIQWVPFVIYMRQSNAIKSRPSELVSNMGIPIRGLAAWFFPTIYGNPRDGNAVYAITSVTLPKFLQFATPMLTDNLNFNEMMGGYVGSITLVLAMASAFWCRSHRIWHWAAMFGGFCLLVAIGSWPVANLIRFIPGFGVSNNCRLMMMTGFCAIVMGSLMLDELIRWASEARPPRLSAGAKWAFIAMSCVAVALVGLAAGRHGSPTMLQMIRSVALTWSLGTVAFALTLAMLHRKLAPTYFVLGLTTCLMIEICSYGLNFNPSFDFRERFPVTPGIAFLQKNAGEANTLFLDGTLPPDLPTVYHIHDLRIYDAMENHAHHELMFKLFNIHEGHSQKICTVPSPLFLVQCNQQYALNIRYVVIGRPSAMSGEFRNKYKNSMVYEGPDFLIARVGVNSAASPAPEAAATAPAL